MSEELYQQPSCHCGPHDLRGFSAVHGLLRVAFETMRPLRDIAPAVTTTPHQAFSRASATAPELLSRARMNESSASDSLVLRHDPIDFGDIPPSVNTLLQHGVAAYRSSKLLAEARFREALTLAPHALPVYFCLYKIHTYQGDLDAALDAARAGLAEAAAQAGWPPEFDQWPAGAAPEARDASRFALYTLKALAFIRMKRGELQIAREILRRLGELDPSGHVGWHVVRDLLEGLSS